MSARGRTRSIGVLGGGIAGFAAAIAFRRALPDTEVTLFVGDGTGEPEYPGAAAPHIHRFHRLVGIDSDLFRRRTGAVTVSEAEIHRGGGSPFRFVPFAEVPYLDGAALHQLWLRQTASGFAGELDWADVARRARGQEDVAAGLGVRFEAEAYLALLAELASLAGVTVAREGPGAEDVATSYDLVIDTCGPGGEEDWLPVDGLPGGLRWSVRGPAGAMGSIERIEMAGTRVLWDNAAWQAEGHAEANAAPAGRVRTPWKGKVLAVGLAAVRCETFDGQPLAVALAGIARAIELLPRPGASGLEAAEYNRRTNTVHDFLLDWAAERWGSGGARPAGLVALRRQFLHRGRIPFRDEDPVPAGHWISWLLGSGERPQHVDLTAMAVPEERLAAIFARV